MRLQKTQKIFKRPKSFSPTYTKNKRNMGSEEGLELMKGMSKSDAIVPKLPLIDPATGKRQDGRSPTQIRQLCESVFTLHLDLKPPLDSIEIELLISETKFIKHDIIHNSSTLLFIYHLSCIMMQSCTEQCYSANCRVLVLGLRQVGRRPTDARRRIT